MIETSVTVTIEMSVMTGNQISMVSHRCSHGERSAGLAVRSASDILARRATDGIGAVLPPYVPGTAPGDWQPTPPLLGPPQFRQLAAMVPFALTSPEQFLPPGPPPLTSPLRARPR